MANCPTCEKYVACDVNVCSGCGRDVVPEIVWTHENLGKAPLDPELIAITPPEPNAMTNSIEDCLFWEKYDKKFNEIYSPESLSNTGE